MYPSPGLYPGETSPLWNFGTGWVGKGQVPERAAALLDNVTCSLLPLVVPRLRAGLFEPDGKVTEENGGRQPCWA